MSAALLQRLRHDPQTAGLALFAVAAFSQRALAVIGCLLVLWALWRERRDAWPVLCRSPVVLATLLLAGYVLLRTLAAAIAAPENAVLHVKDAARILYLCALPTIAWALRGEHSRVLWLFVLAATGFVAARLWHFGWQFGGQFDTAQGWWQMRMGLGLETIGLGYYAGTLLLGLIVFAPRLLGHCDSARRTALVVLGLLLLAAATLQWVILSQSRAAWLALLPLLVTAIGYSAYRFSRRRRSAGAVSLLLAGALLVGLVTINAPTLKERLSEEQHTLSHLLSGNLDAIRSGDARGWQYSIGARITMLRAGWAQWRDAPLVGKGPAATKLTLQSSSDHILPTYNDYHNVALDILVRYGIVGLALVLLCLALLLRSGWRAYRRGDLPDDTALFLACGLTLLLASTLTNFRLLNFDFRYWTFLLCAPLLTFDLRPLPPRPTG
jgi:O-antigen ligase